MDAALSLADPVLHWRGLLESGGCGPVRLPHQSAAAAVLHAGPEPHAVTRTHCVVRRVWPARRRTDVVLPAWDQAQRGLERTRAEDQLLGIQHRARLHGSVHTSADRRDSTQRGDRPWLLVCA